MPTGNTLFKLLVHSSLCTNKWLLFPGKSEEIWPFCPKNNIGLAEIANLLESSKTGVMQPAAHTLEIEPEPVLYDFNEKIKKNCCQIWGFSLIMLANALFWCVGKPDLPTKRMKTKNKIAGGTE
jgi:hypothetical protein